MKKVFAIVFAAVSLLAVSCKDNDGFENPPQNDSSSIVGTTWQCVEEDYYYDDDDHVHHYVETGYVSFLNDVNGQIGSSYVEPQFPDENSEEAFPFTYTFNDPNGTITVTAEGETRTLTFNVEGDKLTLCLDDEYYPKVFYKQ